MTKWDQDRISPSLQRILVSVYSSVDIIACIGLLCILILGARTKRLRSNLVLLNFEFVFFFTALGQTLLIWTGYPYTRDPPRNLCVVSGAYIGAAATFKAGAAFGLIGKVCAHICSVAYPSWPGFRAASATLPLILVPWLVGFPLFFTGIAIGLSDPLRTQRTSIYYCIINAPSLTLANMIIAGILEILTLIMAIWTAWIITRVRLQLRSMPVTTKSPVHYSLIIRTLIFSGALIIALAIGAIVAVTRVTHPIPGMVIAFIDLTAFVIFASDPILLRSMTRRARGEMDTSFATGPSSAQQTGTVSMHISTSGPVDDHGRNVYALSSMHKPEPSSTSTSSATKMSNPSIIVSNVDLKDQSLEDVSSKGTYP